MKRRERSRAVILITGCRSGIGFALAEVFGNQKQYLTIATARADSLERLKEMLIPKLPNDWESNLVFLPLDVADRASRAACLKEIEERFGGVDILINNAGISYRSVVEHMEENDELHQMMVNYFGPMELIKGVLPHMRAVGRGKVINVSSVSGMLAMPTMASYSASKHALEGATEALWYELRPLGINVTLIAPGFIRSNSFRNVYYSKKSSVCDIYEDSPYCDYYFYMTPFIEKMMGMARTTPQSIARLCLKVVRTENPPLRILASPDAFLFHYLRRFLPRRLLQPFLFRLLPSTSLWAKKYTLARRLRSNRNKPPKQEPGGGKDGSGAA